MRKIQSSAGVFGPGRSKVLGKSAVWCSNEIPKQVQMDSMPYIRSLRISRVNRKLTFATTDLTPNLICWQFLESSFS